jgi:hypothetical protein
MFRFNRSSFESFPSMKISFFCVSKSWIEDDLVTADLHFGHIQVDVVALGSQLVLHDGEAALHLQANLRADDEHGRGLENHLELEIVEVLRQLFQREEVDLLVFDVLDLFLALRRGVCVTPAYLA